jgi:hypothetical protein
MTRLRYFVLLVFALLILVRPGSGCSFEEDDTPTHIDPDKPYAAYVGGKLGIVSGELRVRHLVVAYDTLSGRGLTPGEQKAAIDVDRFYNYGGGIAPEQVSQMWSYSDKPRTTSGVAAWFSAVPQSPTRVEHTVAGDQYETFFNCLDDAYAHAASTLADRRAHYSKPGQPDSPEITDWIQGQLSVFSNCSDLKPEQSFAPNAPPPPPAPVATMPKPEPASAPLWLRQDRAYQIAAAHFYAVDYDSALADFRAIAEDKASPWSQLSRYLVARTLIRRATVPYKVSYAKAADTDAGKAAVLAGLAAARDELKDILGDPQMAAFHGPAQHLLDYVMIRLDPAAQANELARRLTAPPVKSAGTDLDLAFRQNLIDLTVAYNSLPTYSPALPPASVVPGKPFAPLLVWMQALGGPGTSNSAEDVETGSQPAPKPASDRQDALAQWGSTHQPQWLVALLATAASASQDTVGLAAAAHAVPANSPAYASVTYHRLRLESPAARYSELTALMPSLERDQPRSAINLFADLEAAATPTLDSFLVSATRITPISIQSEPGEGSPVPDAGSGSLVGDTVTLCGVKLNQPDTPHLDTETALVFNQRMPLSLLRTAALSPLLPANIRFSVAHMTWTRALLLDDFATARGLAPYLAQCQPAFKPWLDRYDAATTAEERHITGLLALMRFTSADPTITPWTERDFAVYDDFRGNWWCDASVPYEGATAPQPGQNDQSKPMFFDSAVLPRSGANAQPDPPFLTPTDRAAADSEMAALRKVGDASDYFATQALAWVKAHPDDARNPDVLGFAERVVRNACRSNATKELNHTLFEVMHQRYPKSEWAVRYKTWE